MDTVPSPTVELIKKGVDGTDIGVTGLEFAEATEVPLTFVAYTTKVYAVPLVRVVTDPEISVGPANTDPTGRIPAYGVIV
jgi:hypothetical protein